ncbi:uncharacterized protein LOC108738981 isoform X2 [Agrilus planipennis]|nr:uncharacterized protein LOC108738981 isoform X2 [Agrilus planipennis]
MDPKRYPLNLVPSKPFEEIYMANIPSRNLDLSMVDPNKSYLNHGSCDIENLNPLYKKTGVVAKPDHLNKRADCNRRVLEGLNSNAIKNNEKRCAIDPKRGVNEVVVDLYNYKYENFKKNPGVHLRCDYDTVIKRPSEQQNCASNDRIVNKMDQSIQTQETAVCLAESKDSNEPTVKDLLQIMKQQNEQLLLLQNQVAMLLENQKKREPPEVSPALKEIVAPPSKDNPQILPPHKNLINTRPLFQNPNKYSIDVMTSFEVSIRPQVKSNKVFKEHLNHEPKIQEITEIESNFSSNNNRTEDVKNTNLSLALDEPLKVPEQSHSPDNSIHVEMQDYSSDSDDENPINVGWTLYDNIVGQVNQVLKKKSKNEICRDKKFNPLQAVKEATINHLKTMGINVPIENLDDVNSGCDSSNSSNSSCSPTEISFAVKQLLMKYMPDEQLAKVATENSQEKFGNRRSDFSFATLQYMQKYNLLAKENKTIPAQMCSPVKTNANKILDITALKQQPKLM